MNKSLCHNNLEKSSMYQGVRFHFFLSHSNTNLYPYLLLSISIFGILFVLFSYNILFASDSKETRIPAVSGSFYPDNKIQLQSIINNYLQKVLIDKKKSKPKICFVPHAGYVFSGKTVAHVYKRLQQYQNIDTFIIIGASHRTPINKASFFDGKYYQTPLGKAKINQSILKKLRKSNLFKSEPNAHKNEHSVEVQVPFIQTINSKAKIISILVNKLDYDYLNNLADFLFDLSKNKKNIFIISSDMSHFHDKNKAGKMDVETLSLIKSGLNKNLYNKLIHKKSELCGGAGVLTGLMLAKKMKINNIEILKYSDSSDVSGNKNSVVGYFAGIISTGKRKNKDEEKNMFTDNEKKKLLEIARTSMVQAVKGEPIPEFDIPKDSILNKKWGAFVTLKKKGDLRGCIGYILAYKPLWQTISEMAVNASLKDTRFSPVNEKELNEIEIEISALSELEKIDDVNKIEVGKHGIYMKQGRNSGLLLPQVPVEYGWDREEFLMHTCRKASLASDAWKDNDTEKYIYTAEIFHED